ncbi:MAG: hypothetical protein KDD61_15445 [Bdellovibrionales bacterium]|nr:hypothetical protein [Bdellovibrionales bacterium]
MTSYAKSTIENGCSTLFFGDPERTKQFFEEVVQYPSGDNAQPFDFKVTSNNTLSVSVCSERSRHALNFNDWATYISLGALIEQMVIVASQFGFSIEYDSKTASASGNWNFSFSYRADLEPDPLCSMLSQRESDRRSFHKGDLSASFQKSLTQNFNFPNSRIQFQRIEEGMLPYLSQTETLVFNWKKAFMDILKWISFDSVPRQLRGLPWKNLGISVIESKIIQAISKVPFLFHVFYHLRWHKGAEMSSKQKFRSSAGVLLISTSSMDSRNLINCGRSLLRVWTYLCGSDYGVQLHTSSTLPYCHHLVDSSHLRQLPSRNRKTYLKLAPLFFQKYFSLDSSKYPVILMRFGKSSPIPDDMKALRQPIQESH